MIHIKHRKLVVALLAGAIAWFPLVPARAQLVTDPQALYVRMKAQYDKGAAHGWTFGDWQDYLSTILDAGRTYSLRSPEDPNVAEITGLTVDVSTRLRYDPLSNRDAAEWYVREAAAKVAALNDPVRSPAARALLTRLDTVERSPSALAKAAEEDATANVMAFPSDKDALLAQVETTWRAWHVTRDPAYRTLALKLASATYFPLANLADPTLPEIFQAARSASDGGTGFTAIDAAYGRDLIKRRAALPELQVIARVNAPSHGRLLSMRAPADEYFGRQQMSVIGIRNEIVRIGKYLDVGWGSRMANAGVELIDSIDSWHKEYPHDTGLPDALLRTYKVLGRIDAATAKQAADRAKLLLTVEYTDSSQARELLTS